MATVSAAFSPILLLLRALLPKLHTECNGLGEITAAELGSVMESLGLKPSKTELQDIMNEIDVDQSGTISFDGRSYFAAIGKRPGRFMKCSSFLLTHNEEFATIMAQKVKASDSDAELRAAFEVFDKDGSGTINAQELFQVMKSIGEDFTEAQIDEMLKEADHDGNGTIDCESLLQSASGIRIISAPISQRC